jgi:isochorismate synthase
LIQFSEKLKAHYSKQLPFVCLRKAGKETLQAYFCQSDELIYTDSFSEEGFVFAPFDDRQKAIVFLRDESDCIQIPEFSFLEDTAQKSSFTIKHYEAEKHQQLVSKGIEAIQQGKFQKVVLSRQEMAQLTNFDLIAVFSRMLELYSNAFVYVWYHPKVGLWMGATPERLVSLEKNEFVTMALAGTQPYKGNEDPQWGEKEKMEHQFVVDYIVSQIQNPTNGIILKDFQVSETYTSRAGDLLHLKADIRGEIGAFNLKELLQTLHPTPAVCGLPKEEAKDFILRNEHYDRSFYTGFLGEMNVDEKTELFVNLRCAEFKDSQAIIYVGGGVTRDSHPKKEWEETLAKAKTIQRAL